MTSEAFLKELKRIILSQPKKPLIIYNSDNCEYCNFVHNCKNLQYCFDTVRSNDSFYLFDSFVCANSGDCDYAGESELCYESVDAINCFNSDYLEYCHSTSDSAFSYNCKHCKNVFGCVNLNNKSFCLFNRQLSEGEYKEQVKKYKALPPEKVLAMVEDLKKRFPLTQTIGGWNENTDYGNYIHNDKNCYMCFDAAYDEDCAYLYDSFHNKNCMDMTYGSAENELAYQIVDGHKMYNSNFCVDGANCLDSSYLFNCFNVKNSIGCVGLKNKQYCILNRQFSKEDYEKISSQILADLKQKNYAWADLVY